MVREGGEKARDSGITEAVGGESFRKENGQFCQMLPIVKLKWGESFDNLWALRDSNEGRVSNLQRTRTIA